MVKNTHIEADNSAVSQLAYIKITKKKFSYAVNIHLLKRSLNTFAIYAVLLIILYHNGLLLKSFIRLLSIYSVCFANNLKRSDFGK